MTTGTFGTAIGSWIKNHMEDREAREENWRQHMKMMFEGCNQRRMETAQPLKAHGFHRSWKNTARYTHQAEMDRPQNVYDHWIREDMPTRKVFSY
eukprot:CAMPEP_0114548544 /NCGR_PEP_ID=MMETSP0114-20121206/5040_1 /TAXON_ID=31324 /ORGANISM="Goniomonas sp, Strain m" /LENGTH=94 /DNA_ID=CAMNT_0001733145 /DNA_START=11 /DNA_END=295 /DNA_ORIENTATION=+